MILRQFLHTDPTVAASYIVGCGGKSSCIVVDPIESAQFYVDEAERLGMAIRYVVDTHVHADHRSSGPELAMLTGAPYVLHESTDARLPHQKVVDGDLLEIGNVQLEVLHVPGHTPEHIALLVTDRTRSTEPWMIFTGHTLMVGDMGRTELATSAEEGANRLYESAQRLARLSDFLEVFPGAFSGSVCGRGLSGKPSSTIGFERRFNRAFGITDRAAFVDFMVRDIPPQPQGAAAIRRANLGLAE
jgi:hydroxyacylglutathione hydrolase